MDSGLLCEGNLAQTTSRFRLITTGKCDHKISFSSNGCRWDRARNTVHSSSRIQSFECWDRRTFILTTLPKQYQHPSRNIACKFLSTVWCRKKLAIINTTRGTKRGSTHPSRQSPQKEAQSWANCQPASHNYFSTCSSLRSVWFQITVGLMERKLRFGLLKVF